MKLLRCLAIAIALSAPEAASADVVCQFSVSAISLSPDGWVLPTFTGSGYSKYWWFCSTTGNIVVNDGYSSTRNVPADSCKTIYAQLLSAKLSNRTIQLNFNGPADCSAAALPSDGSLSLFPYAIAIL